MCSAGLCICGVFCVLQPWNDAFNPSLQAVFLGYLMSASLGIFMMSNVLLLSTYNCLQDPDTQKSALFWMLLLGITLSICMSLIFEEQVFYCHGTDWLLILAHSSIYFVVIPLEIYFSSRLPGVVISVIGSTSIIYVFIAQYTFLSHIHSGYMNWIEVSGICIIIVCSIFPSIVQGIAKKKKRETNFDVKERK